jgi:hypothetical protein
MTLETKDKNFNNYVKYTSAFIGLVVMIIVGTNWIVSRVKTELSKEINSSIQLALSNIVYKVKELEDMKKTVSDNDKLLSLLVYRVGAMEDKMFRPHISKEFEKPEETEPVTVKEDR